MGYLLQTQREKNQFHLQPMKIGQYPSQAVQLMNSGTVFQQRVEAKVRQLLCFILQKIQILTIVAFQ